MSALTDRLVASPIIYDVVQDLAGRKTIYNRLRPWLWSLRGTVLDIGGGTGRIVSYLRPDVRYACLDCDVVKLRHFHARRRRRGNGLLSNAKMLPFGPASVDNVLMCAVLHHLPESTIHCMLREAQRVLRPNGRVIVVEPVANARRTLSRAMWALDQGDNPQTADALTETFGRYFVIDERSTFSVFHEYLALRCSSG